MFAKVIQLGLIELRGKIETSRVLDILQTATDGRDNVIVCDCSTDDLFEGWLADLQVLGYGRLEKEVHSILVLVIGKDGFQHVGNVVCLDDTACAPYLEDLGVVDVPVVLLVCLVDDVDSLDIRC